MKEVVVVGLSGGVDSSFAAAKLKEQGYDVIGVMLNLWSAPDQEEINKCCSMDAMVLAKRVANLLDIPFYAIDARELFRQTVVEYFITGYSAGITPNPCIVCNTQVRWKVLLEQAQKMGASKVATGHYARILNLKGQTVLSCAKDSSKDQSYVLSRLPSEYLERTILPVGEYLKSDVRNICKDWGLPTASRKDSQDLCFLGDMDYRLFLDKYTTFNHLSGKIIDKSGMVLGEHQGLSHYTVGQRKGLRIAYAYPLYVIKKDLATNTLVVGEKTDLAIKQIHAINFKWINPPKAFEINDVMIKVRYSTKAISGKIKISDNQDVEINLEQSTTEATAGQIAAVYSGEICLGGGIIV